METTNRQVMLVISQEEWESLRQKQEEILQQIKELQFKRAGDVPIKHITAKEFMVAVRIGRTKFDQLVNGNKIKVIKKKRKVYVPVSEVDRYFTDYTIK